MKAFPPWVYCPVHVRPSADMNLLTILNRGFIIQLFLITRLGKQLQKNKININDENAWNEYARSHPNLFIARACLKSVPQRMFWAIADIYPDLVALRHVQVRPMGNFSLNGGRKPMVLSASLAEKIMKQFVISCFDCSTFKPNFDSCWCNLLQKASNLNATDGTQISPFITNLDRFHKMLL